MTTSLKQTLHLLHITKPSGSSPPPTPGKKVPSDLYKWRFEIAGLLCETTEVYRPGGYHPVTYGDKFCKDTYTVIRKLGYGSFSTVWLARDSRNNRYVALKILTANASATNTEPEILQSLSKQGHMDPRSGYITTLFDTFIHEGPNGRHRCLVFEPMGPSTAYMVRKAPEEYLPDEPWTIYKYPRLMVKKILSDTLHGLSFLHENGIVHGNVQPGNLLFCIRDINNEEGELQQDETTMDKDTELLRIDGKTDKWAPEYVYLDVPLRNYALLGPDTKVKISGLGSAFRVAKNNRPSDHLSSSITALRAPEMIVGKPFGTPIDIWALGCLLFEFLTDRPLFLVNSGDPLGPQPSRQERNLMRDDHLLQFNDIIGNLPDDIVKSWPRAKKWFNPVTRQPSERPRNAYDTLEVLFAQNRSDEIDDTESAVICSLIRKMLVYSPARRPSATELLRDPWFST